VIVLPTIEHVAVQLPATYVTELGITSRSCTPVALLVDVALFW